MRSTTWTRRQFGKGAAALAGLAAAAPRGFALPAAAPHFTVVGSMAGDGSENGSLHVFAVHGSRWTPVQTLPAAAPVHLLPHPTLPVLYAVHHVDTWDHLPRGAVSAYRIDRATGQLAHLHTQPLSLSATHPRHAVLTAGATHLFVAAEGGGIYNLWPVAADGSLQPASAIRKEPGKEWSERAAAPHTVALHPDGTLLAADSGHETVTRLRVEQGALTVAHGVRVHHGVGPAQFVLAPDGRTMYTLGSDSLLSVRTLYRHHVSLPLEHHQLPGGMRKLAMRDDGQVLLAAANDVTLHFRIDPQTGKLGDATVMPVGAPDGLFAVPRQRRMIGLHAGSGHIQDIPLSAGSTSTRARVLATVPGCTALAYVHSDSTADVCSA